MKLINIFWRKRLWQKIRVSSHTPTQQQINHYANQHNPNNSAHRANNNNHSNQMNPNNSRYQGGKK